MRTTVCRIITQRVVINAYHLFAINYRPYLQVSRIKILLNFRHVKTETLGCPETSIINYNYSLRDIPDEKSSHRFWVSSRGKEFVTIFVKTGQTIRQLKHKYILEGDLKCRHFMLFIIKTNHKMFVFSGYFLFP
jgi:hypothetical protein